MRATSDRGRCAALLAAMVACAGCGGGSQPGPIDGARGREILTEALEGWKRGETPAVLAGGSPSIHVVDHDWQGEVALDSYEFQGDGEVISHQWRGQVLLTQTGPGGEPRTRLANYSVVAEPVCSVVRNED